MGAAFPIPAGAAGQLLFNIHPEKWIYREWNLNSTNNRMELTAAIKALETLPSSAQATLFTDSEYLKRGITEWLPNWRQRGWKRKSGALANQDLWMKLDSITQKTHVDWRWVKGHAGNALNERVDRMVRKAIEGR